MDSLPLQIAARIHAQVKDTVALPGFAPRHRKRFLPQKSCVDCRADLSGTGIRTDTSSTRAEDCKRSCTC